LNQNLSRKIRNKIRIYSATILIQKLKTEFTRLYEVQNSEMNRCLVDPIQKPLPVQTQQSNNLKRLKIKNFFTTAAFRSGYN